MYQEFTQTTTCLYNNDRKIVVDTKTLKNTYLGIDWHKKFNNGKDLI